MTQTTENQIDPFANLRLLHQELSGKKVFWQEVPVLFDRFITSKEHLNFVPLSDRQYDACWATLYGVLYTDWKKKPVQLNLNVFQNIRYKLAVLDWGKGCLTGDSQIFDRMGKRYTIAELYRLKKSIDVNCIDDAGNLKSAKASVPFIKGTDIIYEVKLISGRSIKVTAEHKFLTPRGWRPLKELSIDDYLATPRELYLQPSLDIEDRELKLVGYLLGDGSIGDINQSPVLTNGTPEVIDDYCSILSSYGLVPQIKKDPVGNCYNIHCGRGKGTGSKHHPLNDILRKYSLFGTKASNKFIPKEFTQLTKEKLCIFLSALYGTDGWIYLPKKGAPEIGYCSISKQLISDLHDILQILGIRGKVESRKPRPQGVAKFSTTQIAYSLIITTSEDVHKFCSLIRISGKEEKQKRFESTYLQSRNRGEILPTICTQSVIQELMNSDDLSKEDKRKLNEFSKKRMTRLVLKYFISKIQKKNSKLELLNNIYWDRIIQIRELEKSIYYDLHVPKYENYIANGIVNHNSGKDTVISLVVCYLIYVMLCMKNAQEFFGLPTSEPLDIVNVAYSAFQAKNVFFDKLRQRLMEWAWLKRYPIVLSGKPYNPGDNADPLDTIMINLDAVTFPKRIRIFSRHSQQESYEGLNIICYICDEIAAFRDNTETHNADKVFNVLETSCRTRFGDKGKGYLISYPRYEGDYIEMMYKRSLTDPSIYGDKGATWEIKPRHLFSAKTFEFEGHIIPMDFYDLFDRNPTDAKCKLLCIPPTTESPFVEYPERVDVCVGNHKPLIEFEDIYEEGYIRKRIVGFAPGRRAENFIITVDLGLTDDEAGFTISHKIRDQLFDDYTTSWVPKKGYIVDVDNVEQIIIKICEQLSVIGVFCDHWNSALMIQQLIQAGVKAEVYRLSFPDYKRFLDMIYSRQIVLFNNEKLIRQIKALQMLKGMKVEKSDVEKKDMVDTIVGACKVFFGGSHQQTDNTEEGEFIADNVSTAGGTFIGSNVKV